MNQKGNFQELMMFIGNVHAYTHTLVMDVRPDHVTPMQYKILEYIFFNPIVTTSQISECVNMSLPNTSREIKKLFKLGLLNKEASLQDRRKITIRLSDPGQLLMQETFGQIEKKFWEQTGSLSEEDMKEILSSIKSLNDNVFSPMSK